MRDAIKTNLKLTNNETRKSRQTNHVLLTRLEVQNGKTTNGVSNGIHLPASRLKLAKVSR